MATVDNTVVLDLGSDTIKAGYAANVPSDDEPRVVTPCCVEVNERDGHPHAANGVASTSGGERSNGEAAGAVARPFRRPVVNARVVDADALEAVLHYTLYELLGWQYGEEGGLMVAEPLFTPKAEREQLVHLLFEVRSPRRAGGQGDRVPQHVLEEVLGLDAWESGGKG
jgi:actin-related protein